MEVTLHPTLTLAPQALGPPDEHRAYELKLRERAAARFAEVKKSRLDEADRRAADMLRGAATKLMQVGAGACPVRRGMGHGQGEGWGLAATWGRPLEAAWLCALQPPPPNQLLPSRHPWDVM